MQRRLKTGAVDQFVFMQYNLTETLVFFPLGKGKRDPGIEDFQQLDE